jgi:hypothetical protein
MGQSVNGSFASATDTRLTPSLTDIGLSSRIKLYAENPDLTILTTCRGESHG